MTATDLLTVDTLIALLALLLAVGLGSAFRRRYRGRAGGIGDLASGVLLALVLLCLVLLIVVNEPARR